jgi:hypothetical protein
LAPEPEPVEFWVGSTCLLGFVNGVFLGVFRSFRVSSFFQVFFLFWVSFGFWIFFRFQVFFLFRVHPWVKNETRTQFWAGRVQVRVAGAKMHLDLHPSGAKPAGDPKPKLELPSLHKVNLAATNRQRRFKAMMN